MALTHTETYRNGLADYIVDLMDSGYLDFMDDAVGTTVLATCGFGATAFGAASAGIATANAISDSAGATAGTVANFRFRTSAAATVVTGTVTATGGGGDIEISSTTLGAGDVISVTSLTYEASD